MTRPSTYFTEDHQRCDLLWSRVEAAADDGDEARAAQAFAVFAEAMERHFRMEEEVLFPAFEAATGMSGGGPTAVMRMEHSQMRHVLTELDEVSERGDLDRLLNLGDTLLMLVQQHNAKEEGMLYPMADRALSTRWTELEAAVTRI